MKITRYHVEAVDNAKFLGAIERSSHAIYLEDPANMKQPLMRLLHIVKMIYNVSTFYNTPERVASLLVKITNQVIRSCKRYITESGRMTIWNQEREVIEQKLTECIKLNEQYRDAYHKIKNRKVGREAKEFNFSEKYIFGRFDSFCARLKNLLCMFRKINVYTGLFQNRMEALLPEESVEEDNKSFEAAVRILTLKDYDYLDFRNQHFDKDYQDFLNRMDTLTERLRTKLETTYDGIWDTPHAFQYLTRFEKLTRVLPIGGMVDKYSRMIATFRSEMDRVTRFFKKQQNNAPVPRNFPETSGRIYWVRSLLYHLKHFIDHFEEEENLKKMPEYKKLVKQYNDTGVFLMKFELNVQEKFRNPRIRQIETMIAKPVLKSNTIGELSLNFDPFFYNFLKENEKLCKLDIPLPSVNQFLIKRKNWFFEFKDMVDMMLENYYKAINGVVPDLKKLFTPHLNKVRSALDPGIADIRWTSHGWKDFTDKCLNDVEVFRDLVDRANDIYENRVEKILESMTRIELYEVPKTEPWTLDVFLEKVKDRSKEGAKELHKRSAMVEDAIEDLIALALEFKPSAEVAESELGSSIIAKSPREEEEETDQKKKKPDIIHLKGLDDDLEIPINQPAYLLSVLDRHQIAAVNSAAKEIRKNYSKKVSDKLVSLIRGTLRVLAKHFNSVVGETPIQETKMDFEEDSSMGDIVFVLSTYLNLPNVEVKPSIDEVQNMLNQAGKIIVSVTKGVGQWRQIKKRADKPPGFIPSCDSNKEKALYNPMKVEKPLIEEQTSNFFKIVSESKEVTKGYSMLSSCLSGLKLELSNFQSVWDKYSEIWTVDREEFISDMSKSKPKLKHYEEELHKYKMIKSQLATEKEEFRFGTILVSTKEFKSTLDNEILQWNNMLTKAVHMKYKREMDFIIAQITDLDRKLDRPINDLDDIRIIMETQKKIREIEIDLDMKIETVEEAFSLIAKYELQLSKEDTEKVENLQFNWLQLQTKAMDVQILLLTVQEHFQRELITNLEIFQGECDKFVEDYHQNGPMQEGLSPKEASDKLQMFQNHFDALWRKHSSYSVGEDLFGLQHTEQPELNSIKKELNLLQRLYKLYNDVIDSVNGYYNILWQEINVEEINNELMEFGNRCRKLPKGLKEWPAFHALKKTIDDFNDICPLLELMSNKAMKYRHWQRIQTITGHTFDLERAGFALKDIMEAPLLQNKEDIEDVCISALKEKDIEAKLRQVTSEWSLQELSFQVFKNRGELLLRGDTTADTVSQAEDSLMVLGSLLSNRYNAPFKKQIQKWVTDLSNTNEILERWLLVQNMWVYLEAVFVGGDIAKQLPKEAKRFYKIDKSWQKIMTRAHETPGVVNCCVGDEFLRQTLPYLQEQLEMCQKSLTGYLEKKRLMFPRFFFVSDPALLEILGQASDSHTIQSHLLSIFDNTASVKFHDQDYNKILSIVSAEGEVVHLERPVRAEGSVEIWLNSLLQAAQEAIHCIIRQAFHFINDNQFDLLEFVTKFQAQIGILGLQMVWTRDSENALGNARSDRKIMGETNNKFLDILNTLISQTTKNLDKMERTKFETLITVHMHQRDIFDMLVRLNIRSMSDFEWLKQARFYFKQDMEKTQISITDVNFYYQNEYLGCQERLVITPLTDRCYITLAQAIGMCMGGAPAGPAGTGKTETVKDMAKTLGKYVVVFNCSDQMDYKGLGRIYKGLAQSGSWGCFDEFNRIALAVLSVAAQQISVVLTCKKEKRKQFIFTDGDTVDMNPEFGIFVTMNPTYAGRQELPENLKIQFRNVAMMVPDRQIIIRVKLASCGFLENITLARKFFTLYKLCEEQLTKQVHYDFGLRNILSVLRTLGATKRAHPKDTETTIVMRVLRDMNLSKLVDEDEPLFMSLINDLFPNLSLEKSGYPELEAAIDEKVQEEKLVNHQSWTIKLIQLFETQRVRHGIMVLGPSGAGKSSCISILMKGMTLTGKTHKEMRLNPKSINAGQMFGRLDVATNDWSDGIFSALWRKSMKGKKADHFWLVLDGPVDPMWIENLNSVLDDNKTLTLANGDRLPMSPQVKLIFEPQNVDNASPATVSRCGMVYMSSSGLDWQPLLASWFKKKNIEPEHSQEIKKLFESSFFRIYKWSVSNLHFVMNVLQVHVLNTVFVLLEALLPCLQKAEEDHPIKKAANAEKKKKQIERDSDEEDEDEEEEEMEKIEQIEQDPKKNDFEQTYIFSLIWALGGYLENAERLKLESHMRERSPLKLPALPKGDSIFNYNVNPHTGKWSHWNDSLRDYVPPDITPMSYGSLLIPNVSSIRTEFLVKSVTGILNNLLLIGEQGSAKTTMINSFFKKYKSDDHVIMNSSFSSTTTPQLFQKSVEVSVDKRMGSVFGPPAGKKMTIFVDDVNLPEINSWGDQVTNEFFRAMIEMKGFYSLEKPGDFHNLVDLQYMAAMIHPGGGRNDIPQRLKRHFITFNCTLPTDDAIDHIFGTISQGHFNSSRGFTEDVSSLVELLVPLTRKIWKITKEKMLPTPSKFHYVFNLRDLSRMWLGMIGVQSNVVSNAEITLKLWVHEITRVLADRFVSDNDKEWFDAELIANIKKELGGDYADVASEKRFFVDFMRDAPEPTGEEVEDADMELPKIYEPVENFKSIEERLKVFLEQHNEIMRGSNMDLVFFPDAIVNLIKISRIIRNPGGNAMLVGVGGSGKQSLTKLASFIAGYKTFQITMTRTYNTANFVEDLKILFRTCGIQGKGTTFLFTDQDIKEEGFLEYVNNVLAGGLISNLFTRDEQGEIVTELMPIMKRECSKIPPTPENAMQWFLDRVKLNLHVVLCFSPVGEKFRSRALKFPGLISGCTINWFQPWPKEALVSVATHFLHEFSIQCTPEAKRNLFKTMASVQDSVSVACNNYFQRFRRQTHVTPKSFLSFISSYKSVYAKKEEEIGEMSQRMNQGLEKLHEASKAVELLKEELAAMEKELLIANQKAEKVLVEVTQKAKEAEVIKDQVKKNKDRAEIIVQEIEVERLSAEEKLEAARPALEEAEEALNTIKPANIATVRKLGRPPHLIMRVMDCAMILFRTKLPPLSADPTVPCPKPSWSEALKVMSSSTFLSQLLNFPKDTINDEMVELLEPYLTMEDYNMATAKRVCGDVAGLLCWTKAMAFFFGVNKEVLPLKINLAFQEARLAAAMKELETAQRLLARKEKELRKVQNMYSNAVKEKQKLTLQADICRKKMSAASTLINGLGGEKLRWTQQSRAFKEQMTRLIGDTLLACGFLSYSGPFNQEFRNQLMNTWKALLKHKTIPYTNQINVITMLVDGTETSEWALQGLPSDELSLQNAAIVTKARSYPLLIDPQGQGKIWIKTKEQYNDLQVTNLNHKYFRTHLEDSLSLGRPLLIEDVSEELDPILDNLLEKNFIKQGKIKKVMLGDREMDVLDGFNLYITTKLPNPAYSPEVSARCAIIDFTVTMNGLEDQLLGRVIRMEKTDLETERIRLVEDVLENKATMKELEDSLLEKLNSVEGSIVDDEELIGVLQDTKTTAYEVSKKLQTAAETEIKINAAREEYRLVATRGSILYFLIVEMSKVNVMYQTSLRQFLVLFDASVTKSKPTHIIEKRINNILDYLTKTVWKFTDRGLYEHHKFLFTMLLALKIDLNNGHVSHQEFLIFLKGGASLDLNSVKPKPFRWMLDVIWLNLVELSKLEMFNNLLDKVVSTEKEWKYWCDTESPEEEDIPCGYHNSLDVFRKLLLIRSWCPDRTLSQARKYIFDSLGADFLENTVLDLESMIDEADNKTPLICLLSTGSDPSGQIETISRIRLQEYRQLAMGQGQEEMARKMITDAILNGHWLMLQNCHLCLEFCEEIMQTLSDTDDIHPNFRLWLTTEVNKEFPIGLLQMALKYTNEPPQGIRASLKRTYADITQDTLDYSNHNSWPCMLFAVAFLHTVVLERRKFGPLGWNIPYEFNRADFTASTQFIMNHLDDLDPKKGISWQTVCFMLGEVQYGGRVTDDFDKRLLNTFTNVWFSENLVTPGFKFYEGYPMPESKSIEEFNDFITNMPLQDIPEVFGLHSNADISYQINTAKGILDTILNVQPKESSGGKQGDTREAVVAKIAEDMMRKLPRDYIPHEVKEALVRLGGMLPMNIFLRQEIDRMQKILTLVRRTLIDLKMALEGTIVMSDDLKETLDFMYDAKVPENWKKLSWRSTTLGFWFTELLERDGQFKRWCFHGRPKVFWMTGFFNPQGFLTAMRQEVTRAHKGWALDSVICQNLVTRFSKEDIHDSPPEGVYVHGLFLEGGSLDRKTGKLVESRPKVLYEQMPVIYIYAINTTAGKKYDDE